MSIIPCIILEPQGFNEIMVFKIAREYPHKNPHKNDLINIVYINRLPAKMASIPFCSSVNFSHTSVSMAQKTFQTSHPGGHHKSLQLVVPWKTLASPAQIGIQPPNLCKIPWFNHQDHQEFGDSSANNSIEPSKMGNPKDHHVFGVGGLSTEKVPRGKQCVLMLWQSKDPNGCVQKYCIPIPICSYLMRKLCDKPLDLGVSYVQTNPKMGVYCKRFLSELHHCSERAKEMQRSQQQVGT